MFLNFRQGRAGLGGEGTPRRANWRGTGHGLENWGEPSGTRRAALLAASATPAATRHTGQPLLPTADDVDDRTNETNPCRPSGLAPEDRRVSSIRELVDSLGGFARKRELVVFGANDRHLTDAVKSGEVARARNGWYSTVSTSDARFRAMRVGGRLTGASALHAAGAWMKEVSQLHVSLPRNSARLRSQWNRRKALTAARKHGAVLHWDPDGVHCRGTRTSVDLRDALLVFVYDAPFEEAVAVLDWATRTSQVGLAELESLVARLPARLHGILEWIDPLCDSYPESITRTRLRMRGFHVTSQVPVGWLERIDLVVEDHVAIEVDGEEHHRDRFHKDRLKDLRITIEGRHGIRISVPIIQKGWDDVVAAITSALEARSVRPRRKLRNRSRPAGALTRTSQIGRRGLLRLPVSTLSGLTWS